MTEIIYSYKEINKKSEINKKILDKFIEINDLIASSSQFQDTKKKLSNILYSAKWKNERNETNNPFNLAYQSMNKLCETNFDDVYDNISKLVFLNIVDLEKLASKLIIKIVNEKIYIELYIKMIYKILINNNWIVNNISFRQLLLNNIKNFYNNNNSIGLFYLIGYFFKYKIISFTLITLVLNDYIQKIENNNEEDIEKLLVLWSIINTNIKDYNNDSYNMYNNIINNLYPNLSKRLKYMSTDSYNIQVNKENINNDNNNLIDLYYNYITYIEEFDSIKCFLDEIKNVSNNKLDLFLKCVIKYTIDEPKQFNKIKDIIKEGFKNNYWTKNILIKLINNIEEEELNEIIIDAPYYKKHLNEFKNI
jgi:hypothetical protein